jgi:hypothetical protein
VSSDTARANSIAPTEIVVDGGATGAPHGAPAFRRSGQKGRLNTFHTEGQKGRYDRVVEQEEREFEEFKELQEYRSTGVQKCGRPSGREAPDGEGARPRAPRRRFRSQRCIFVFDQGRLWASETTDREDAIPPGACSALDFSPESTLDIFDREVVSLDFEPFNPLASGRFLFAFIRVHSRLISWLFSLLPDKSRFVLGDVVQHWHWLLTRELLHQIVGS